MKKPKSYLDIIKFYLFLPFPLKKKHDIFFNASYFNFYNFCWKFLFLVIVWTKTRVIYYVNNWMYTTNHRRIAVNYFWFVILSGIVGMVLATVIRLELAYPGVGIFAGDSLQYLSLVSAHGVIMVFFMIMPLLFGAFANFLLPTQLGVHDVAFPRLNSAAFWFLPAGLIMLAQLVCVDRRYQRMNCFNIREVQSLLKQRFFDDLVNAADHRTLLPSTVLNLRHKLNSSHAVELNHFLFYNFTLENQPKIRKSFFSFQENSFVFFNKNSFFFYLLSLLDKFYFISYFSSLYFICVNAFLNSFFYPILSPLPSSLAKSFFNWLYDAVISVFNFFNSNKSWGDVFFSWYVYFFVRYYFIRKEFYYWYVRIWNTESIYNFFTNPSFWYTVYEYFFIFSLVEFFTLFNNFFFFFTDFYFFSDESFSLNKTELLSPLFYLDKLLDIFGNFKFFFYALSHFIFNLNFGDFFFFVFDFFFFYNKDSFFFFKFFIDYKSDYFNFIDSISHSALNFQDVYASSRYFKTDNPLFKYDYKSGDYFPKLYKEAYPHLFSTLGDLTGGIRQAPWFLSSLYMELINSDFGNFYSNFSNFFNNSYLHNWNTSRFSHSVAFYNFYFSLNNNFSFLNSRWISLNSLNQKFYKMFHTSSMQQRIYSNWRQLKFTREAWRCKLLSARHQKTLFRRYVNEDGVFWSIERNAKDLLPGWAMITPFSSRTRFTAIGKVDIGLMGVLLVLNSSIISGANFLVTYRYLSTLNNRKMRDARAFFTEGIMVASWMMIAANPMLVIGIIMLLSDRHWQTSFFDYSGGGDTVLFQHMFWFFGHPEVYIIIIPTFGFTNTIVSHYLKKRVSARASLLYSMYTIAFLGFFVWGHHMYMVGLAHTTRMLFSTLTVMISVPAATKLMHWCVTLVNSAFAMELPLLFVLTFVFFFVSGGISGMAVAHTGMDVLFHDTFYVIGHFHVMLAGAAMFASFGAFYFYFVSIFGVKFSRIYAYLHYVYYLLGQLLTVIPMIWLGYAGMPRRVLDYPASMGGWHSVISGGHMLSVAGLIAFFIMIFDSLRQSKAAIRNTFGVGRYNIRLNFYIFEAAKLEFLQGKSLFFFRFFYNLKIKLNGLNYINLEHYETTIFSYSFLRK